MVLDEETEFLRSLVLNPKGKNNKAFGTNW